MLKSLFRRPLFTALAALALFGTLPLADAAGRILARTNRPGVRIEATSGMSAGEVTTLVRATTLAPLEQELVNLKPAGYLVTAHLDGWPDIQRIVTVRADKTTEVAFEFKSGTLHLQSDPTDAVVRLSGKTLGRTPLTLADLPPGAHEFSLQYGAWPEKPFKATVPVKSDTTATIRLPHGKLSVETTPPGAELTIDGEAVGRTPVVIAQLPEGSRKLTLRAKGYETTEFSLAVKDGAELKIHPVLLSSQELLDPQAIISALWREGPARTYDIAPNFNELAPTTSRNGVVRNLDRGLLDQKLLGRMVRYTAAVKAYEPSSGRIDFAEQAATKSKYRVSALLSPTARADQAFVAKLIKGATIEVSGKLVAVEEPSWPAKTIYFELSEAEAVR